MMRKQLGAMSRKDKPVKTVGKGNKFNDIEAVLEAARACFERFGVEKTRLEDVAKAVGISRPLLYKLFDGRQALTDAVINFELQNLVRRQAVQMKKHHHFKDVLIEGIVSGITLAQQDTVLMDMLLHSSVDHLPGLLLDSAQPAHQVTLSLWKPYFDKARESGELTTDFNDDDLMEWLMSIQYMFLLREEVSGERIRALLTMFVSPVLTKSS